MSKHPVVKIAGKCTKCGIIAVASICMLSVTPFSAGAANEENQMMRQATGANTISSRSSDSNTVVVCPGSTVLDENAAEIWTYVDEFTHQRSDPEDPTVIETAEHAWDDGVITVASTCTTQGVKTYTCADCGAVMTEVLPALEHKWGTWIKVDDSVHERTCEHDSSHVETESHSWDNGKVTIQPTATEAGVKTYTCSVCGGTHEELVPASGTAQTQAKASSASQSLSTASAAKTNSNANANSNSANTNANTNSNANANSNESDEIAWGLWTRVNNSIHQRVDMNDPANIETAKHTWDDGVITTAPTCTTRGIKTYTCEDCGAIKTEVLSALGHKWGAWTKVDDSIHERVCKHDPSHAETGIHSWDNGKVTRQPTATATGIRTYTCSVCGGTREEIIPATGSPSTPSQSSSSSSSYSRPVTTTPVTAQQSQQANTASGTASSANRQTATAVNVSYSCTAGNEIQWAKSTTSSANFTFKRSEDPSRTVDHFTGVKVDGKELTAAQFEKQPGDGLTLKLLPAYLETLTSGSHIVVASFDDGQPVSAKFTVTASSSPAQPPANANTAVPSNTTSPVNANGNVSVPGQQPQPEPAPPDEEKHSGPVEQGVPMAAAALMSLVAIPLRKKFRDPRRLF